MSGLRVFVGIAVIAVGLTACSADSGDSAEEMPSTSPAVETTRAETTKPAEPTEESTLADGVPTYAPLEGDWMETPAEARTPADALELVCGIALDEVPTLLEGGDIGASRRWDNDIELARSLTDPTFLRFLDEKPPLIAFEGGTYVQNTQGIREWGLALQDWCTWNLDEMGVTFTPIVD